MNQPSKAATFEAAVNAMNGIQVELRLALTGEQRGRCNAVIQSAIATAQQENVAKIEEMKRRVDVARAFAELPENYCLACGGTAGHHEGCPGTTGIDALRTALSTANQRAAEYRQHFQDELAAKSRALESNAKLARQLAECEAVMVKKDEALRKAHACATLNDRSGECEGCIVSQALALQPSTSALAEYVKDKDRLDWLEAADIQIIRKGRNFSEEFDHDLRRAIDAALAHYPETKEGK